MTTQDQFTTLNEGIAAAMANKDAVRAAGYYTDDARLLTDGRPRRRTEGTLDRRRE